MRAPRVSQCVAVAFLSLFVLLATGLLHGLVTDVAWAAEDGGKKIAAGKPKYLAKDHEAWKDKGRIVGITRDCPGCEVKALDAKTKKVIQSHTVEQGGKSYELQWLQPGEYILLVTAAGYEALDVHKLVVKAKHDLRVDLEF